MSTKPNDNGTTEEDYKSIVEVYNTEITRRGGETRKVVVDVEYIDPDGHSFRNKVIFDVNDGWASFTGFETPVASIQDLRVVPAAEYVAKTAPGVKKVREAVRSIETELAAGNGAVENRLEKGTPPEDLQRGFEWSN